MARTSAVDLWHARYSQLEGSVAVRLSDEESARARRAATPALGRRFALGRSMLRQVLGAHLSIRPQEVPFAYGPFGKPQIPGGPEFNLSHSGDALLLAVSDEAVGVDVQQYAAGFADLSLAHGFFDSGELSRLTVLNPSARIAGFHRSWVRKEAYLKGLGLGLFGQAPAMDCQLSPFRIADGDAGPWTVCDIQAPEGYAGALALQGEEVPRVAERQFSPASNPGRSARSEWWRPRAPSGR